MIWPMLLPRQQAEAPLGIPGLAVAAWDSKRAYVSAISAQTYLQWSTHRHIQ